MTMNFLTGSAMSAISQSTQSQITIETALKAVGRPTFTLADKNVDKDTRKFSASKELLYQILCLGIYLAIIPLVFKKGMFGAYKWFYEKGPGKGYIHTNKEGMKINVTESFKKFSKAKEYLNFHKAASFKEEKAILIEMLSKEKNPKKIEKLKIRQTKLDEKYNKSLANVKAELKKELDNGNKHSVCKGAIELSSIVGSVLGLTILAPQISHLILHPIMNFVGLNKKEHKPEEPKTEKIDTKA